MKIVCAAVLMLSTTLAFSQNKPEVCSAVADSSGLTGCEQAVLENFQLKQSLIQQQYQTLQTQLTSLTEQYNKTIALIDSKHPGFKYNAPDATHPAGFLEPISKVETKPVPKK